ncbi:MAG: hypothetical protein ACT6Q5_00085 [Sphingopyxis solisilvae]|uniref:hypothetical protein n=1 Tax=Sphingopyxis solisilvae TaxID=1886788 RepID=UPI004034FD98
MRNRIDDPALRPHVAAMKQRFVELPANMATPTVGPYIPTDHEGQRAGVTRAIVGRQLRR